jgi:hypothetical protein
VRASDVRRLLDAARAVYGAREGLVRPLARSTGLSAQGVRLGFEALEREATDDELRSLVHAAGDSASVHVVLSANVFVAPLRALILARAAAETVTVRPSSRDPVLTHALLEAAADPAMRVSGERDVSAVEQGEIHVYGRDASIAAVRARARPGVRVRGHGPGTGVAVVSGASDLSAAAESLAGDIVVFDQRGCLSPRVVLVEGDDARAGALAAQLHECLGRFDESVPRGELSDDERSEAARWRDTMVVAGRTWLAKDHGVAVAAGNLLVPPVGRHVLVVPSATASRARQLMAPFERFVVAVGCDDPSLAARIAPSHARVSSLGSMQHPALDGPVDRRDQ